MNRCSRVYEIKRMVIYEHECSEKRIEPARIYRRGGNGEMANLTNENGKFAIAFFSPLVVLKSDISDIHEINIFIIIFPYIF